MSHEPRGAREGVRRGDAETVARATRFASGTHCSPAVFVEMIQHIFIAALFSLFYAAMYPILVGGFVLYVYPYWPPGVAVAWILGGILLQAGFCLARPRTASNSKLRMQAGAGVLYAASIVVFSGGCYQS